LTNIIRNNNFNVVVIADSRAAEDPSQPDHDYPRSSRSGTAHVGRETTGN